MIQKCWTFSILFTLTNPSLIPPDYSFSNFPPTVKPRIMRETLRTVTIKVGRSHKWAVDYIGEPEPEASWIFKETVLEKSDRSVLWFNLFFFYRHK